MPVDIAHVLAELKGVAGPAALTSAATREAVLAKAKEAAEYAKTIAPVNKTGKPHTTPGGYTDTPGQYRDSIEAVAVFENGEWRGRVISHDWKAQWIEYGTEKMPKQAVFRRAAAHARGSE